MAAFTLAETSGYDTDCMAHEVKNVYYLVLYKRSLLTLF